MKRVDGWKWNWHRWFAWFPVKDEYNLYHWLVWVERKQDWRFMSVNPEDAVIIWIYRKI